MNESMLTKILAMLDPEQRVEIYKIPESSESPDDRVLILTGEAGRIDRQSLIDDGYEISGLYVNVDGTVVLEVEESDPDDGELTLYDVLRCMYPSEKAVVVYRSTYLNINNCVKAGIIYGKVSSPLPFDSCRGVRHECVLGQQKSPLPSAGH